MGTNCWRKSLYTTTVDLYDRNWSEHLQNIHEYLFFVYLNTWLFMLLATYILYLLGAEKNNKIADYTSLLDKKTSDESQV